MADITMCSGLNCPLKEKCYRFTAIENQFRQSYFQHPPYDVSRENCSLFWEDTEYRKAHMTKHLEEPSK
jgi:hypothetical protein